MPADPTKAGDRGRRKKILLGLLREARTKAGLRQVDLAKRLCKPQSFVSKYESGERGLDLLDLQDVCQSIGITEVDLVYAFRTACLKEVSEKAERSKGNRSSK